MNTALLKARGWIRGPWWEPAAYCALVAVAAAMRLWDLGSRALHHDESLHAQYAWNLYTGEGFRHDPMMHGPFQMEAIAGVFFALGDSDYTARLVSAAAGIALVALPFFFRDRLGRIGALLTSAMLAFSPTLLYFSRFARNDVIMAVWALGLVISMWRYLDEGKPRYLYAAAVFLALAFTTKETAYLLVAVLGMYLAAVVAARNWPAVTRGITAEEVSPPEALGKAAATAWSNLQGMLTFSGVSRETGFLILLVTLSMPLWSAMVGILQETPLLSWSGLTLASPVGGPGPIGAPARGGIVIAVFVAAAMTGVAVVGGVKWNRAHWWRYALVFWAIWIVIQTTFFTHLGGAGSGLWQSLGYWVAQQDVARGGQPWYYYLVITPVYEHLPMVLAISGGVFYVRRSDKFGAFLAFWAAGSFFLYSMAGEKMPWLAVNLTLPMIVLAGKFLGDVVQMVQWRHAQALLALAWVPVFAVVAWSLAYVDFDLGRSSDAVLLGVLLVALAAAAALGVWLVRRLGRAGFAAPAAVSLAVLLLAVGIRAGWVLELRERRFARGAGGVHADFAGHSGAGAAPGGDRGRRGGGGGRRRPDEGVRVAVAVVLQGLLRRAVRGVRRTGGGAAPGCAAPGGALGEQGQGGRGAGRELPPCGAHPAPALVPGDVQGHDAGRVHRRALRPGGLAHGDGLFPAPEGPGVRILQ